MKKYISIIIGKLLILIGKRFSKGSSLPGGIALKFNSKLMTQFKMPDTVIAVTGSSGKGSISSMLATIYKELGHTVAYNEEGSNLSAGITSMLLKNCKLDGTIKADVVICEIDERYAKYIFKAIHPNYVIITNITRDQPPRQGHVDLVYEEIKKALDKDMHLILNADDPMLQKFNLENHYQVTYYGIEKNKFSYQASKFDNLNFIYCPKCHKKLVYDYYHFENLGSYQCPSCSFTRPKTDYHVTNIDYDASTITINHNHTIHIPYNILYCIYNTLATFTTTSLLKLDTKKVCQIISSMNKNHKLFDLYQYHNRYVYTLNNKNENSTTFNQSILFTTRYQEEKTIVIGWKEISRRYHFDDLSWLYDIDFELLKENNVDKFVCVGRHRYDIATRLKYSGIDEKKILVFDNLEGAIKTIKEKTKGSIFGILNFDYVEPFHQLMLKEDVSCK